LSARPPSRTTEGAAGGIGLSLWWTGIRPRTLSLSAVPVLAGSALAWHDGSDIIWANLVTALVVALLIQAGTNLLNDAADGEGGNDGPERQGPRRLTGSGMAAPAQVRRAAYLTFLLALLGGLYLVAVGGWLILGAGIASLAAGWAYSSGPRPLSHTAWGEVFVVMFFGVVAVGGSYYLQRGTLSEQSLVLGFALGLHAAAVLLVNNIRDHDEDCRAGRRTLAAVMTPARARLAYITLLLAPFPLLVIAAGPDAAATAWVALPFCLWLAWRVRRPGRGQHMNTQLIRTAQAQLLLGFLVTAGFVAERIGI
jgi:1,4-dihydroxy-2-naphthoate octaprenyltransferase